MGDIDNYQPLTQKDKATVILYRLGIAFSAIFIGALALTGVWITNESLPDVILSGRAASLGIILSGLFISVGLSVFFIHLYVSSFHKALKKMYFAASAGFLCLLFLGGGNPALPVLNEWYGPLLLLPLAACLGFITAKEAFCFKLLEGYLLALIMPAYLVLAGGGALSQRSATVGLVVIAVILVFFTLRKIFMPSHYDIGDKSAYQ